MAAIVEALQGIQAAAETANEQVANVIADHDGEGRVRVDSYDA